ncbi:thiamine pyrophosphokinase [Tateyamaria omphalii]|uniref:thiamine diphosphokinase n=1 Tax=Tateyamaria omphalii TaxID=299262 RepID=UPI001677ADDE|nr:thiamine diphosphokinase [Tateyamaria omphalii]GGX54661.1 thiamine pyrophosphokinase [Tateyamaria omphalii]
MTSSIVYSSEPVALFGGGEATLADVAEIQALSGPCVAADGGAKIALEAGVDLDAVIGDFDSVTADILRKIPTDRHHHIAEQNSTDFDKALRHIAAPVVLAAGFLGGRVDHQLACFTVLARYADRPCILIGREEIVFLCPPRLALATRPGDVVSLYPLAAVEGTSTGLYWPIDGLAFHPTSSIGTSNAAEGAVTLTMSDPAMIVIAPRRCLPTLTQALVQAPQAARWPVRAARCTAPPQS